MSMITRKKGHQVAATPAIFLFGGVVQRRLEVSMADGEGKGMGGVKKSVRWMDDEVSAVVVPPTPSGRPRPSSPAVSGGSDVSGLDEWMAVEDARLQSAEEKDHQQFLRAIEEKVGRFEDCPWSFLGDTAAAIRGMSVPVQVTQVAVGAEHVLLLANGGCVWAVGRAAEGQLGLGDREEAKSARVVRALVARRVVTVAAGGWHSAAVDHTGVLFTWGSNREGQLALGDKEDRTLPCVVDETRAFAQEVEKEGSVAAWEALKSLPGGIEPREGKGGDLDRIPPGEAGRVSGAVRSVALGAFHTLVVRDADGKILAAGTNEHGECGLGKPVLRSTRLALMPGQRRIEGLPIVRSGPAARHTVVVTAGSGNVWTCGRGSAYQLGHKAQMGRPRPADEYVLRYVESLSSEYIVNATCGESHTLVVRDDGRVMVFGTGADGQLGLGAVETRAAEPRNVPRIVGAATAVFAGTSHSFALVGATGAVFTWGNASGYRAGIGKDAAAEVESSGAIETSVLKTTVDEGDSAGKIFSPMPLFAFQTAARRRELTNFPFPPWDVPPDETEAELDEAIEFARDAHVLASFPKDVRSAFLDAELLALKRSFDQVDEDHSGSIDVQELHTALQAVAPPHERVEHHDVSILLQKYSTDGDSELSLVEYVRMVQEVRSGAAGEVKSAASALAALMPGGNEITETAAERIRRRAKALEAANLRLEARRVFLDADNDRNGTLEPIEIAGALQSMGLPKPPVKEARLLAMDLSKANVKRDGRDTLKSFKSDHALMTRDRTAPTFVPRVGLDPWLDYYAAARTSASDSLLGRAFVSMRYRPAPRVTQSHLTRFIRAIETEAAAAHTELGEGFTQRIKELGDPGTRRGKGLLRGHLDLHRAGLRDTHASVIAEALLTVPIAHSIDIRGNFLTDIGAARIMVLLENQNLLSESCQGAGGAGRIDDSGLEWMEGFAKAGHGGEDDEAIYLATKEDGKGGDDDAGEVDEERRKEMMEEERMQQLLKDAEALRTAYDSTREAAISAGATVEEAEEQARRTVVGLRMKQKRQARRRRRDRDRIADVYGDAHLEGSDDDVSTDEDGEGGGGYGDDDDGDDGGGGDDDIAAAEAAERAMVARNAAAEESSRKGGLLGWLGFGIAHRMNYTDMGNLRGIPGELRGGIVEPGLARDVGDVRDVATPGSRGGIRALMSRGGKRRKKKGEEEEEEEEKVVNRWMHPVPKALAMPVGSAAPLGKIKCRKCGATDLSTPLYPFGRTGTFVDNEDELHCSSCGYRWTAPVHFVSSVYIVDPLEISRLFEVSRVNLQTAARKALRRRVRKKPTNLRELLVDYKVIAKAHLDAFREAAPQAGVLMRADPITVDRYSRMFEDAAKTMFPVMRRDYFRYVRLLLRQRVARGVNDLVQRARALFRVTRLPRDAIVFDGRVHMMRDEVWDAICTGMSRYTVNEADLEAARLGLFAAVQQLLIYFRSLMAHIRILDCGAGQTISAFLTEAGEVWISGGSPDAPSRPPRLLPLEHPKDVLAAWKPLRRTAAMLTPNLGIARLPAPGDIEDAAHRVLDSFLPNVHDSVSPPPTVRALVRRHLSTFSSRDKRSKKMRPGGGEEEGKADDGEAEEEEGDGEEGKVVKEWVWVDWMNMQLRLGADARDAFESMKRWHAPGMRIAFGIASRAGPGGVLVEDGVRLRGRPRIARVLLYAPDDGNVAPLPDPKRVSSSSMFSTSTSTSSKPSTATALMVSMMAKKLHKRAQDTLKRGTARPSEPGTIELRVDNVNGKAIATWRILPTRSVQPATAPNVTLTSLAPLEEAPKVGIGHPRLTAGMSGTDLSELTTLPGTHVVPSTPPPTRRSPSHSIESSGSEGGGGGGGEGDEEERKMERRKKPPTSVGAGLRGAGSGAGKKVVIDLGADIFTDVPPSKRATKSESRSTASTEEKKKEEKGGMRGVVRKVDVSDDLAIRPIRDKAAPGWEVLSAPIHFPPEVPPDTTVSLFLVFGEKTSHVRFQWVELM